MVKDRGKYKQDTRSKFSWNRHHPGDYNYGLREWKRRGNRKQTRPWKNHRSEADGTGRALKTDRDYFRKIIWAAVVAQICFFYRTADLGAITPKSFSSLMPKNRLNLTES